ncbi:MAG: hypothetical protein AB1391_03365 [Candidatus Micrarchaeota archaeon]
MGGAAVAGVETHKRQIIVPIGKKLSWLEARESVKDRGGLPQNVLHDDILVKSWSTFSELKKGELKTYYDAWAREVLIYPEKGGQFKKGEDVVDAFQDISGRKWVFPACCVPKQAVGKEKVGLVVDPESVEVFRGSVVILAPLASVVVLDNFIQHSGRMGKVDERTRIPLEILESESLSEYEKRWLWRTDGAGVRPLVRTVGNFFYDRRYICADVKYDSAYGVAYVGLEEARALRLLQFLKSWRQWESWSKR